MAARSKTKTPRSKLKPDAIVEMFRRFAESDPEPASELEYVNSYTLLVAVVLSAQATDVGVNKATKALFAIADTPEKMVALGEDAVRDYIKTIGLYRNKAKNVIGLSQALIAEHVSGMAQLSTDVELIIAIGHDQQQCARALWTCPALVDEVAGQIGQELQRQGVGSVEVLEHKDHGKASRQPLDDL